MNSGGYIPRSEASMYPPLEKFQFIGKNCTGLRPSSRPWAQFFSVQTDLGRQIKFLIFFHRISVEGPVMSKILVRIINNYPPKRWIVVDIYREAKRRCIYPPLFTDPEVDSCFSIYQIRWIKNAVSLMATISSSETFAKRRTIFLSVRKTVNFQGYSKLREPIKTCENCYPLIW